MTSNGGKRRAIITGVESELLAAYQDCCDGLARWPLILVGDVGTGKTFAMGALIRIGAVERYYVLPELLDDYTGRTARSESIAEIARRWRLYNGCAVDEIGIRTTLTEAGREGFQMFLDSRTGSPIVMATNVEPKGLASIYDDRIMSRLTAGTFYKMRSKDRRRSQSVVPIY